MNSLVCVDASVLIKLVVGVGHHELDSNRAPHLVHLGWQVRVS